MNFFRLGTNIDYAASLMCSLCKSKDTPILDGPFDQTVFQLNDKYKLVRISVVGVSMRYNSHPIVLTAADFIKYNTFHKSIALMKIVANSIKNMVNKGHPIMAKEKQEFLGKDLNARTPNRRSRQRSWLLRPQTGLDG